jgi:two-component system response regulator AtoC
MKGRILVVDDDPSILRTLDTQLRRGGHEVVTAPSAVEALNRLAQIQPDLVITDLRMPGMDGLELLKKIRDSGQETDVLVITAHEDMRSATEAMKAGAVDYLVKPLDLAQIEFVIARSLESRSMRGRAERLDTESAEPQSSDQLVGRDPRMIEIYKLVGTLAANRAPVLIRGETGTGKERIARAIHYTSNAAREPFVAVNCTTLVDTLLESELFGHTRGAFTGAVSARRGFLELAGRGTVFLDEIGDTSPAFQAKLLRVLDDGEYYAVGGERPLRTEARFLAATHRPLEQLVDSGAFRQDLYYRLRVVEIVVPPLRERRGDIPALADHLLDKITRKLHADAPSLSPPALDLLSTYDWPGNVRELENALTRAAVLARGGPILPSHLALDAGIAGGTGPLVPEDRSLAAAERRHLLRTLAEEGWNKRRTARVLGISRSRLARMIEKHGLHTPGEFTDP